MESFQVSFVVWILSPVLACSQELLVFFDTLGDFENRGGLEMGLLSDLTVERVLFGKKGGQVRGLKR